ncbi:unnamed protein product [Symbiodinium necroappetens]|uniref:Transmembrane protein n=1 Tax=Symbiodinium necroappetens TaxID=1628268 RepID=A0A812VM51_9DINO|nr:unnamed protein product [Symbiodinium necroappetens]
MEAPSAMVGREEMEQGGLQVELEPELLRGIPLHVALSGWGKHWADNGSGSIGTDADASQSSYSLSRATQDFDNFLSHDWETSRWEKLLAMMLLFNTKPAARVASVACVLTAAASIFAGRIVQVLLPVVSYFCFWTALCFAQRGFAMISRPRMVFLDKLCISQDDAVLKQKGILGLAAFLDRSKKLTILWSPRYFSRLWCCYELATFLRHSTRQSIEIMPTKLAVLFFGLFCSTQFISLLYVLAAAVLANQAVGQSQRIVEMVTITSITSIAFLLPAVLCLHAGIGVAGSMGELENQLRAFRIQNCRCFCCSVDHIHPETKAPLPCDRELILEAVKKWYFEDISSPQEKASDEPHWEKFNQTAQQELLPLVLDSVGTGLCMSYFSALVCAASLPTLVFWLPTVYIEGAHYFEGSHLMVWWVRCCVHWAIFPLGSLWYFQVYWWLCLLGVRAEKCWQGKRKLISCLLLLPLSFFGLGPIYVVEFTRAATETPSLLPVLPFSLLLAAVFSQRCRLPGARSTDRRTSAQPAEQKKEANEVVDATSHANQPRCETAADGDLVSWTF